MKAAYEQQPGESHKAFHAWKIYRDLPVPTRSIRAVARKLSKSHQQIAKWAGRFTWAERLKEWAAHLAKLEAAATDDQARKNAQEWARREGAAREANWKMAQDLRKRAAAMLEFPLATTKSRDGKTVVNPTAWNMGHAARLAEVATKLEALAVGAPTERAEVTGKDGGPIMPIAAGQVIVYLPEERPLPTEE